MSNRLEEKIKILGLSKDRIEYLDSEIVEEIDFYQNEETSWRYEVISVDDVVGTTRMIEKGTTWLGFLASLHKMINFNIYNKGRFDEVILNENSGDYPFVVKKCGKYYIEGNGKHRLTMAKCLGNKKAYVLVTDYN